VADLALSRALKKPSPSKEYLWSHFLNDHAVPAAEAKPRKPRRPAGEKRV
jgi:hypothetical protein